MIGLFKRKPKVETIVKEVSVTKFQAAKEGNIRGLEPGPTVWFSHFGGDTGTERPSNMLTWGEMRTFYLMVPAVSACINGIAREIANMKWAIVPRDEKANPPQYLIKNTTKFFQNPNRMKRPFSQLIYVIVKGLGLYSRATIENAFTKNGEFAEIYARDASTIIPLVDNHGIPYGYKQKINANEVDFTTDQLVFMEFNPDDYAFGGQPILDGLLNVCKAIMNSISFIAKSLDYNEIPPGMLWGNWTQNQADAFAKGRKAKKEGGRIELEMPCIGGVHQLNWIEFKRSSKEIRELENLEKMERIVFRAYGVTPVEIGEIQDVNRATALVQQSIGQSKLIRPLVDLVTDEINSGIIWKHISEDIKIKAEPNVHRTRELIIEENERLIPLGLRSVNEGREFLGEKPVTGGDNHVFIIGGTVIKVSDLNKEATEINPININQPTKNQSKMSDQAIENEVKKIFGDRKTQFIQGIANDFFKKKPNTKNVISQTANHIYQKVKNSTNFRLNTQYFENYVQNALKKYENTINRKKYLSEKEMNEEVLKLTRELETAYNASMNETINILKGEIYDV